MFKWSNWKHCKGFYNTFFVNVLLKWILHLLVWNTSSVKNWSWCCSHILIMVTFKLYLPALLVWSTMGKCPFSPSVSMLICSASSATILGTFGMSNVCVFRAAAGKGNPWGSLLLCNTYTYTHTQISGDVHL